MILEFVEYRDDEFELEDFDGGDVVDLRRSFCLTFDDFDDTDNNFDTADIDDGDGVEKKSVDKREDIVDGVEQNGREGSTTNDPLQGDRFFFLEVFEENLPATDFLRGGVFTVDILVED